ncbi:MAG: DUF2284 domain-containing protein [Methanoculleus sp.]|nr:DUF2284 domain-containing protein [Methanoculleus sp.]
MPPYLHAPGHRNPVSRATHKYPGPADTLYRGEARRIAAHDVVVAEWVRFGCKGYGKHMSCPPILPRPRARRHHLGRPCPH